MRLLIIIFILLISSTFSYDKGFKLIRSNGEILYSQDGENWLPFKLHTLKYATKFNEFRFDFDKNIKPQKVDVYDLNGIKQELDISISNTELKINFNLNKIYYVTVFIDDIYYNLIIMKY